MHIVDVSALYSPQGGGIRTYVERKLAYAPRSGHRITIIAPGDGNRVEERNDFGRLVTVDSPRFPLDRNYHYFADDETIHAALDAEAPDFVEASSPWGSATAVAEWSGNAPRALVMHADPMSAYAYRWLGPVLPRPAIDAVFAPFARHLRKLGATYDSVICANRELAERLAASGVVHTRFEPMGVEEGVFSPANRDPALRAALLAECGLPESAGLLLGVGRLAAEKRWPMVIEAVRLAARERPLGLVLLGAGGQERKIRKAIGTDPHIRLLEPVRDRDKFAAIAASADALVHGCEAETYCLAAAEARASGVPVLVPDRGGAADHAANGGGLTYRSADPRALAVAIGELAARDWPRSHAPVPTMRDHFAHLFAHYRELIAARQA